MLACRNPILYNVTLCEENACEVLCVLFGQRAGSGSEIAGSSATKCTTTSCAHILYVLQANQIGSSPTKRKIPKLRNGNFGSSPTFMKIPKCETRILEASRDQESKLERPEAARERALGNQKCKGKSWTVWAYG